MQNGIQNLEQLHVYLPDMLRALKMTYWFGIQAQLCTVFCVINAPGRSQEHICYHEKIGGILSFPTVVSD